MAKKPWHPCDDGIDPIVKAIIHVLQDPVPNRWEQLHYHASRPSSELDSVLIAPATGRLRAGSRLGTLLTTLRLGGYGEIAREVDDRLKALLTHIREWENAEWHRAEWEETRHCFGPDFELRLEGAELVEFLRQIAAWIRSKLSQKAGNADQQADADATAEPDLTPAVRKAYQSYELAEQKMSQPPKTDKEAYDYIYDDPDGLFAEYRAPSYETWVRQVRLGRQHHNTQKNQPRGGRSGRSMVSVRNREMPRTHN